MANTVFLVLLLVIALTAWWVRRRTRSNAAIRRGGLVVTGVATALFLIVALASCVTIVSTKNVGIVLTFSKPTGTLTNGLHLKAPWESVDELDAAIQTDNHVAGGKTSDGLTDLNCITTRIARQAVACVDVSIRWRLVESQAAALYQDYRGFDAIRDSLVTRDLNAAVNVAMESYDVLAVDPAGESTAPPLSQISAEVLSSMKGEIGRQITIESVIIPVLHFDTSTQSRLNALQAQIAQTHIAQQAEQTAIAQAAANKALAASVSQDPNVIVSKCFDLLNEAITKGYALPAGFSCWPGASGAVVVPSSKP